jgi:hypothetical protein
MQQGKITPDSLNQPFIKLMIMALITGIGIVTGGGTQVF